MHDPRIESIVTTGWKVRHATTEDAPRLSAVGAAAQALGFYRKSGFRVIGTATFRFVERTDDHFVLARPVPARPQRPGTA